MGFVVKSSAWFVHFEYGVSVAPPGQVMNDLRLVTSRIASRIAFHGDSYRHRENSYTPTTAAQRHHEQPGAPVLAALGIAHHGTGTVINLRLLAGRGDDYDASFRGLGSAPLAHEALHALVAAGEAVLGDQVLPDGPRIAAAADPQLDGLPVRLPGTGAGGHGRGGDLLVLVGRF